jgi:hypothetical protein
MADRFETHGDFSWCELLTYDVDSAKKFYTELLGWKMDYQPMGEGAGNYTILKANGRPVGGIMKMPTQVHAGTPLTGELKSPLMTSTPHSTYFRTRRERCYRSFPTQKSPDRKTHVRLNNLIRLYVYIFGHELPVRATRPSMKNSARSPFD